MEFEERIDEIKKLSVALETDKPITKNMKRALMDTITVELVLRRKMVEYKVEGVEGYTE